MCAFNSSYPEKDQSSLFLDLSCQCQSSGATGLAAFVEAENLWERDKDTEKKNEKSGPYSIWAVSKVVKTAEIARIGGITGIKKAC